MKLSQFKFNLPKDLIAEKPSRQRDEARLMVIDRKTQTVEHKLFKDLINYVDTNDVVVVNNTKVFPALLKGERVEPRDTPLGRCRRPCSQDQDWQQIVFRRQRRTCG